MILVILLIGFLLRLIFINQSLWLDEATSVLAARDLTFSDIITKFSPGDFHPPLYYLMLKIWIILFGASEISVRMLSVLFGVATIWVVYKIARGLFTNHYSLITPLFLATSPLYIYYSQEARMYVMETLFSTLVAYFVMRITKKKKTSLLQYVGLVISSTLLLYTDYLPVFLLVSLFIYVVVFEKINLKYLIFWVGGTFLLTVPWLPTLLTQFQLGLVVKQNAPLWWTTLGKTNLKELGLIPIKFMVGRISFYNKVFYIISILISSVPFSVSLIKSAFQLNKTKFLWFWFLLPIVFAAIFGIFISGFSYFRLIFVLPAFYLLLTLGAFSFKQKAARALLISGIILVNTTASFIYLFNPHFHREDWKGAVSFIESNSRESAITIFPSKNQRDPYFYYSTGSVQAFGPEGINNSVQNIWLMRYVQPIFDPQDLIRSKIESIGYRKLSEHDFNGVVIWEYMR